jgi:predicted molibdopterin-dependent oxidoreductase YjgC
MPLHFGEARANVLTNDVGDPITGTAEYKVCAVEVAKAEAGEAAQANRFRGSFYGVEGPGPGRAVEAG